MRIDEQGLRGCRKLHQTHHLIEMQNCCHPVFFLLYTKQREDNQEKTSWIALKQKERLLSELRADYRMAVHPTHYNHIHQRYVSLGNAA